MVTRATRILIAEDDSIMRNLLANSLRKWGYDPVQTENGARAWEVLRRADTPRIALLDWNMPKLDGLEITRRVRELKGTEGLYLILLTGRAEKSDIVRGLEAGANDYVVKPYDSEELRARLEVGRRMVTLQMTLAERMRELEAALDHIKVLRGILPICAKCKKIRDDKGYWKQVEDYIHDHSEAQFSHGLCPVCIKELYDVDDDSEPGHLN